MTLDNQSIQEFAEIYFQEFGDTLAPEEAEKMATNFLNLYILVSKDVHTS